MDNRMLNLILDKLENLEKEQREARIELSEMKKEIFQRLDRLEQSQEVIKEFIFNAEKAFQTCERDHKFIENLKKAVCE